MWQRISGRISHLPLHRTFAHRFSPPIPAGSQSVFSHFHAAAHTDLHHARTQDIAGMLHVGSNPQLLARRHLIEPILALNVVMLMFSRAETRPLPRHVSRGGEMPREGCRPEKRSKRIPFLSVKVNLERSRIIHRAKSRFSVVRNEIILIVRHIAQHVERPQLRWTPRHHQLIIEKVRSIFSVRVEGSQKVTRGLVTSRGHRRKMLVPPPHIKATSQHRTVDCGLPLFRAAISDVEH